MVCNGVPPLLSAAQIDGELWNDKIKDEFGAHRSINNGGIIKHTNERTDISQILVRLS